MIKPLFKNQHKTLYHFGYEFLVICPHCSNQAKMLSLGAPYPFTQDITKRFLCSHCGRSKELVPKKDQRNQNIILYGTDFRQGYITIGGAFDWYFGYPLVLQIPVCGKTLWAYNQEHLLYIKSYVEAELRDHNSYYLSIESKLPNWIRAAKNREAILTAIRKLEAKLS